MKADCRPHLICGLCPRCEAMQHAVKWATYEAIMSSAPVSTIKHPQFPDAAIVYNYGGVSCQILHRGGLVKPSPFIFGERII